MPIGKTAKIIGVSIDTLRRWDKRGKFPATRKLGKHRYYSQESIDNYLAGLKTSRLDLFLSVNYWAGSKESIEPEKIFYCSNSSIFQARIMELEKELSKIEKLQEIFPLLVAIAGEIGNNSFDHNIGNWPNVPGIFFGYDLKKKQIVLADRGQGILSTLRKIRPELKNDEEALRLAFTEIISGRAPEARGNGLKFVKNVVMENDIELYFKTGDAEVTIKKEQKNLNIKKSYGAIPGCLALITF